MCLLDKSSWYFTFDEPDQLRISIKCCFCRPTPHIQFRIQFYRAKYVYHSFVLSI